METTQASTTTDTQTPIQIPNRVSKKNGNLFDNSKQKVEAQQIVRQTFETHITNNDGEIVKEVTATTYAVKNEPDYIKIYLKDILYLKDLPKGLNKVLLALLQRANYGNEIILNASIKRQIASEVEMEYNSVCQTLTKFVKGKILIRRDSGVYFANPLLFGRGKWSEIHSLRLTIDYNFEGRTFNTEIENKNEQPTSEEN
jgi:hypothetical protein